MSARTAMGERAGVMRAMAAAGIRLSGQRGEGTRRPRRLSTPSPGSCAPSSQDAFVLPSPTFRAVGIDRVSGLGVFFWDAGAAFAPIERTDELPEL